MADTNNKDVIEHIHERRQEIHNELLEMYDLLGANAVVAISVLSSFMQVVFAFTTLITSGVASRFSEVLGLQDQNHFTIVKRAAAYITLIVALAFALIQIPVAFTISTLMT